jgi:hypothetical protein
MHLLQSFWVFSCSTYGGAPAILLLNLLQLSMLGWVLWQRTQATREQAELADSEAVRLVSCAREEIWRQRVRPLVTTLMLLGPGLGLGLSTLLGALGMNQLGAAMNLDVPQAELMAAMSGAYSEISLAYLLMVGGTPPMLLGPLIVLLGRGLEHKGEQARGGDPQELTLHAIYQLRESIEAQTRAATADAACTHALLRRLVEEGARGRGAYSGAERISP